MIGPHAIPPAAAGPVTLTSGPRVIAAKALGTPGSSAGLEPPTIGPALAVPSTSAVSPLANGAPAVPPQGPAYSSLAAAPVIPHAGLEAPPPASAVSPWIGGVLGGATGGSADADVVPASRAIVAEPAAEIAVVAPGEDGAAAVAPRRSRSEPAFRAFAAAMFDAVRDAAPVAVAMPSAAMTPGPDRTPLDLTQPRWPHAMIDRIERLRDEANLSDTRIRLVPDALGAIDVTLRRAGETVHVAFRAEQADTGRLLADAHHELAALAEARGIKLADATPTQAPAQTSTGGWTGTQPGTGFTGGDRAPRQQPQPSTSTAPPRRVQADDAPDADTRIA